METQDAALHPEAGAGAPGAPLLSLIVVTWNSARWLPVCLGAITAATEGLSAEVWVVDNASADDTVAQARQLAPTAHLIANTENLGFARANNLAIERSRGRYVLLLNPDAEINAAALTGMIAILDAQPDVGLIGCRLVQPDGRPQECYGLRYASARHRSPAIRPGPGHPELVDAAWLGGACLLARRAAISDVGALDPDYLMYYEDMDWGYRMRRAGWRVVYWDGGAVRHHGGGDTPTSVGARAESARRYMTSEMLFHVKHSSAMARRAVWLARFERSLRGLAYYGLLRLLRVPTSRNQYERHQANLRVLLTRPWRCATGVAQVVQLASAAAALADWRKRGHG
jgi:hypothetical protein